MTDLHQLDRMEILLERLASGLPGDTQHMHRAEVARLVIDMLAFMLTERKIEAIRAHRMLTGMGLKESKGAVEAVMSRLMSRAA